MKTTSTRSAGVEALQSLADVGCNPVDVVWLGVPGLDEVDLHVAARALSASSSLARYAAMLMRAIVRRHADGDASFHPVRTIRATVSRMNGCQCRIPT